MRFIIKSTNLFWFVSEVDRSVWANKPSLVITHIYICVRKYFLFNKIGKSETLS